MGSRVAPLIYSQQKETESMDEEEGEERYQLTPKGYLMGQLAITMFRDGLPHEEIAESFGMEPSALRVLVALCEWTDDQVAASIEEDTNR